MTFCIALKVQDGLVGLADTRITSGTEQTTARKMTTHQFNGNTMFLMSSGLRSVRDKALTYFDEVIEEGEADVDKLYKAVNIFAAQIRRVAKEDKESLSEAGLSFNLHAIVGGQMERDKEHKLYLIYPQANWIEVSEGTPYFSIGESAYGKPVLDRCLTPDTSLERALKLGYLSFNAARVAASDVGYPLDVSLYHAKTRKIVEYRYTEAELQHVGDWWQERLRSGVDQLPADWVKSVIDQVSL
ncbi:MAG TPA: peptidase [Phycisphaerales bacterium]|nr:peptidase [Phycisphaerales bacterium]HCD32217.1 peptidase [Phycisphaerales bacterium]|tara:strand:+ start:2431 stop:3159 length:729 start_codon:yes stop_codon:yes gene_type:complete